METARQLVAGARNMLIILPAYIICFIWYPEQKQNPDNQYNRNNQRIAYHKPCFLLIHTPMEKARTLNAMPKKGEDVSSAISLSPFLLTHQL